MKVDYRGRRVTIMGLGHFGGGAAAARWLARQGAIVTITDSADQRTLGESLATLADVPIAAVHLGGHREEDFRGAESVVVNPAVRPDSPWLRAARQSGAADDRDRAVYRELPGADRRRHRQQRQIDHGGNDRRNLARGRGQSHFRGQMRH